MRALLLALLVALCFAAEPVVQIPDSVAKAKPAAGESALPYLKAMHDYVLRYDIDKIAKEVTEEARATGTIGQETDLRRRLYDLADGIRNAYAVIAGPRASPEAKAAGPSPSTVERTEERFRAFLRLERELNLSTRPTPPPPR